MQRLHISIKTVNVNNVFFQEVAKPSQNNAKKTGGEPLPEKEIDIVQVPVMKRYM